MPTPSRRHTNADFAGRIQLLLAEIGLMGVLAYMFIGTPAVQLTGISTRLPPYQYEITEDTIFIPAKHILHLQLTGQQRIVCEGKPVSLPELTQLIERHLYQAIAQDTIYFVSLRTAREANYRTYIDVRDAILRQQADRKNELSLRWFNRVYSEDAPYAQRKKISEALELHLIEWEPQRDGAEERNLVR